MARGWESKSVESQVEDRRAAREDATRKRSREEIEQQSKRDGLEMSRRRVARELEEATSPVHRVALENALRYLDDELKKLR